MEIGIDEILIWFLASIAKFVLTPFAMIAAGYSWLQTLVIVAISSSIGFSIFYFFGEVIFSFFDKLRKRPKKKFSRTTRAIVKIKMKYGLFGMGVIGVILSVPLAGLVCAKFFREPSRAVPAMSLAFALWTVFLTSLSWGIRNLMNGSV